MSNIARNQDKTLWGLELCWWEHTRLILEKVFQKPRMVGTFPFNSGYEVLMWPSAIVAVVSFIFSIIGINYSNNFVLNVNAINVLLVRTVKAVLTNTCNIFIPLWMIYNRKSLKKLLRSVASVEKELDKASLKRNWRQNRIPFFLFPAMLLSIIIQQSIWLYMKTGLLNAMSLIIVLICTFPSLSYLWQYLALHDILKYLMGMIGELEDSHVFANCYHSLMVAYHAIDQIYGLSILIFFIIAMQSELHSLHFAFSDNKFDFLFISQILWTCFYSSIVLLVIKRCTSSVDQSKMINEQLYKRMVYEENNDLIQDELLAFHISSCRKLVFTACGFFTLDNSLICSMFACATTYLVILLEFIRPKETRMIQTSYLNTSTLQKNIITLKT